jgi:multicomponent Na+:H+ antiporter subunit B
LVLFSTAPLFGSDPSGLEFISGLSAEGRARDYFYLHGVGETGSINLVSAIYLGYRAFDTFGETIVLVLSVAGVILITGAKE